MMKYRSLMPLLLIALMVGLSACATSNQCWTDDCKVDKEPPPVQTTPPPPEEPPAPPVADLECTLDDKDKEGGTIQFYDNDFQRFKHSEPVRMLVAEFDWIKKEMDYEPVFVNEEEVEDYYDEYPEGRDDFVDEYQELMERQDEVCDGMDKNKYALEVRNETDCELLIEYVVVVENGEEVTYSGEDLLAAHGSTYKDWILKLGSEYNDSGEPDIIDIEYDVECEKPSKK